MTKKARTNSSNSGQKRRPDLLVRSRLILSLIGYGYSAMAIRVAINRQWNVSKQLLSEDFRRMVRNGWIKDLYPDMNKNKYYALEESGRTVLAGYEKSDSARLTRLENVRHRCEIQNELNLRKFLSFERYDWKSNRKMNNVMMYHGRINGLTVQVVMGKKPSIIITPRPMYISTARKSRPKVQDTVLDVVNEINRVWMLNLTPPIALSGHGQVAMGGKIARELIERNGGGSIKIGKRYGIVHLDSSPPSKEPQIEIPYDAPAELDDLLNLPDNLKELLKRVEKMELSEDQRYVAMQRMADVIEKNSETSSKILDLISGQVKTGNDVGQNIPLNRLSENMFR